MDSLRYDPPHAVHDDAVDMGCSGEGTFAGHIGLVGDLLPPDLGHDRRLQARAYTRWLDDRVGQDIPSLSALDRANPLEFADQAVLLALDGDATDPLIVWCGAALSATCEGGKVPDRLAAAASGSLLARLGVHLARLLTTQAPVSFDAEFTDGNGDTTLSRGILLPYSRDGHRVDHALCALSWKQMADGAVAATIAAEMMRSSAKDGASTRAPSIRARHSSPHPGWTATQWSRPAGATRAVFDRLTVLPPADLAAASALAGEFAVALVRHDAAQFVCLGVVEDDPELLARVRQRLLGSSGQ